MTIRSPYKPKKQKVVEIVYDRNGVRYGKTLSVPLPVGRNAIQLTCLRAGIGQSELRFIREIEIVAP